MKEDRPFLSGLGSWLAGVHGLFFPLFFMLDIFCDSFLSNQHTLGTNRDCKLT